MKNKIKEKKIAKTGFDPVSSWLWARRATSAPLCLNTCKKIYKLKIDTICISTNLKVLLLANIGVYPNPLNLSLIVILGFEPRLFDVIFTNFSTKLDMTLFIYLICSDKSNSTKIQVRSINETWMENFSTIFINLCSINCKFFNVFWFITRELDWA